MNRYDRANSVFRQYLRYFPNGKFKYQAEAVISSMQVKQEQKS